MLQASSRGGLFHKQEPNILFKICIKSSFGYPLCVCPKFRYNHAKFSGHLSPPFFQNPKYHFIQFHTIRPPTPGKVFVNYIYLRPQDIAFLPKKRSFADSTLYYTLGLTTTTTTILDDSCLPITTYARDSINISFQRSILVAWHALFTLAKFQPHGY